jgi:hypothetical protein
MNLEPHIRRMYAEIVSYQGGFGDPIEQGPYDPYDAIRDRELTPFERTGVSIAILHLLDSAIENGTYESAVADQRRLLEPVLAEGLVDFEPLVRAAAEAFLESEASFLEALKQAFERLVLPNVVGAPPA